MYKKMREERMETTLKVAVELRDLVKVHAVQLGMSMRRLVDEVIFEYFDALGLIDSGCRLEEEGKNEKQ